MASKKDYHCSIHGIFESRKPQCPMKGCSGEVEPLSSGVLKDYECSIHGVFESRSAKCPMKGCAGDVQVVFLKAPNVMSPSTRSSDQTLKQLAEDFRMTDIKSAKEGEAQTGYFTRNNKEPRPGDSVIWGGTRQFDLKNVMSGNIVKPVRDEPVSFHPSELGKLTGPKTGSYIEDHEGLKIK